jgi:DNA topoisomerase IA
MMIVLHVAEKPSIAETIARLLSRGRFERHSKRVPVFEVRSCVP